jgi:hypothetical protein
MTPLEIKMLLHIYSCRNDYRDEVLPIEHARSAAVHDAIEYFVAQGLADKRMTDEEWIGFGRDRPSQLTVTEKGVAMVNHLCAVQVPICKWVQP